jgi:hypothetical protein
MNTVQENLNKGKLSYRQVMGDYDYELVKVIFSGKVETRTGGIEDEGTFYQYKWGPFKLFRAWVSEDKIKFKEPEIKIQGKIDMRDFHIPMNDILSKFDKNEIITALKEKYPERLI